MTNLTRLLTSAEREAMNDEVLAKGFYRDDRRVFLPGMGWLCPWYWNPPGHLPEPGYVMCKRGDPFLSVHYWRDWADKRPPIEVVCPDGNIWCVDRKSSNGDGWIVTGEWPNITASPSIDCQTPGGTYGPYYHGFLQGGVFSADVSGRVFPVPNIPPGYGREVKGEKG